MVAPASVECTPNVYRGEALIGRRVSGASDLPPQSTTQRGQRVAVRNPNATVNLTLDSHWCGLHRAHLDAESVVVNKFSSISPWSKP